MYIFSQVLSLLIDMEHPQKPETHHYPQPPEYSAHPQSPVHPAYSQPSECPSYSQPGNQPSYEINQNSNVQAPIIAVQAQPVYLSDRKHSNFIGAIILSCVTIWFCGWICGLIAFILAMVGQCSASNGDEESARPLLISSYVFSAIGIVIGIAAIIYLVVYYSISYSANTCKGRSC